MLTYYSIQEMVDVAEKTGKKISEIVLEDQVISTQRTREEILAEMVKSYEVMKEPFDKKGGGPRKSMTGLTGNNAELLKQGVKEKKTLVGGFFSEVLIKSLTIAEHNAGMGRIVAAPTAGASGILPAMIMTIEKKKMATTEQVIMSMFTAGAVGMVFSNKASISGAEGGCQAECGTAAAMAAAAAVELRDGNPRQVANAAALAIKNLMGLVCDPVCGLVEVPCVKRNAGSSAVAMAAAEMALAGISSMIPIDEVIDAMREVGQSMPQALKETAGGGLAATKTARKLEEIILSNSKK